MATKKLVYLLIGVTMMLAGSSGSAFAQSIPFVGSAPKAVIAGQQFQLQYTFNNQKGTDFRIDPSIIENFNALAGPNAMIGSSTQIVNGKSSSIEYITYTYVFSAKKEGEFNIPPASIKMGNSEYKSNALTIKVLPPDKTPQQGGGAAPQQQAGTAAVGGEDIFMRMIVSNRSVYEQEGFLVTFKLYTLLGIQSFTPKFPEFEGFLAQDVERKEEAVQWEHKNYNGRNYQVAAVKQTVLYPQRSGQIKIGGAKADAIVQIRNQARARNFFGDFFDQYQSVAKELTTSPVTIDVKPLPPGKPASFSGAVGSFTMTSAINKTSLKANEAITVKLTIKGNGNIKLLKTPEIKFPNDFEPYDPKVDNNIKTSATGASGTKTIEYMAIPRYAGDFEIPAVEVSFLDTKSGTYKTITSDQYSLHVEKSEGGGEAPVVSNYTNRQSVQSLGKDIHYIKTGTVHFKVNKDIFFGSLFYVMVYLMIAILFAVFFIIYRKQVKENANIALVRTRKANKTAVRRLRQAGRLLKESKSEAFYEEVLRALWGYLSDKLNIPPSSLTKDNVALELTKYGVSDELSAEFLEIINTCEFARYAPSGVSGGMDKLFDETVNAIGNMENKL